MRETQFVVKMGMNVCYVDFSDMKSNEEINGLIESAKKIIRSQAPKSVFALTNMTNMYFNTEVYNAVTQYAKGNEPYVRASAVVGLNGLMQIFYNSFLKFSGRDVRAFKTEEEALQYLLNFHKQYIKLESA
jgi:hypothetical protein